MGMNSVNLILSVLLTLAMVVIFAPNILAFNRGKILRNIAIWLAIFLLLGLVYQNLGPGSLGGYRGTLLNPSLSGDKDGNDPPGKIPEANQNQGYQPPSE